MSKLYGMKIGAVGVEFTSREDRDKAIQTFTRGSGVEIATLEAKKLADAKEVVQAAGGMSNE